MNGKHKMANAARHPIFLGVLIFNFQTNVQSDGNPTSGSQRRTWSLGSNHGKSSLTKGLVGVAIHGLLAFLLFDCYFESCVSLRCRGNECSELRFIIWTVESTGLPT